MHNRPIKESSFQMDHYERAGLCQSAHLLLAFVTACAIAVDSLNGAKGFVCVFERPYERARLEINNRQG
jgi:hypothetical protein